MRKSRFSEAQIIGMIKEQEPLEALRAIIAAAHEEQHGTYHDCNIRSVRFHGFRQRERQKKSIKLNPRYPRPSVAAPPKKMTAPSNFSIID